MQYHLCHGPCSNPAERAGEPSSLIDCAFDGMAYTTHVPNMNAVERAIYSYKLIATQQKRVPSLPKDVSKRGRHIIVHG